MSFSHSYSRHAPFENIHTKQSHNFRFQSIFYILIKAIRKLKTSKWINGRKINSIKSWPCSIKSLQSKIVVVSFVSYSSPKMMMIKFKYIWLNINVKFIHLLRSHLLKSFVNNKHAVFVVHIDYWIEYWILIWQILFFLLIKSLQKKFNSIYTYTYKIQTYICLSWFKFHYASNSSISK